ncbi:MAG: acyl-CoA dehydrogenase family protein [Deltaproteobacteria bacterium]|nr:acyl-CoA dehydrogenase family protein [Deltaproteobacteria bacterium]
MSYFLTEEQQAVRDTARKFAQKEVRPRAVEIDHEDRVPEDLVARCAELNFFALFVSPRYGGLGADLTTTCLVLEEIAKESPAFAGLLNVEIVLCPGSVEMLGSEAQKQKYLVPSAKGERLLAWSQTEPAGAANVMAHQTRLTPDGQGYRLNGVKIFCTQGTAKNYLVMARTSRNGTEGYGCAIVEQGMPGFVVARYEDKLGWRGTNTGTVMFNDVFIPPENVLGDLLSGNHDLGVVNQASFLGHAATSLGCLEGMFERTLEYVKGRTLYGAPMTQVQPVAYWLAEIYAKIEACRSLLYTSARRLPTEGRRGFEEIGIDGLLGSLCKAHVGETAVQGTNTLLQMWGGAGIMDRTGVNRYLRDARTKIVAEGATEMHYAILSAALLGEAAFGIPSSTARA